MIFRGFLFIFLLDLVSYVIKSFIFFDLIQQRYENTSKNFIVEKKHNQQRRLNHFIPNLTL
jgi:hypothetical protein